MYRCFFSNIVRLGWAVGGKHAVPLTRDFGIQSARVAGLLHLEDLLIQATTSWELGFDGLSKLMKPVFMYSLMSRFRGDDPWAKGV